MNGVERFRVKDVRWQGACIQAYRLGCKIYYRAFSGINLAMSDKESKS